MIDEGMGFLLGGYSERAKELCAEIVSLLSFSALSSNSRVGYVFFSDSIESIKKTSSDGKIVRSVIERILSPRDAERKSNIEIALDYCSSAIKKSSIIFIVSDFLSEISDSKKIKLCAHRLDLVGLMIKMTTLDIPSGFSVVVSDGNKSTDRIVSGSELKREFSIARENQKNNADIFSECHASILEISSRESAIFEMEKYFKSKLRL
jgi:hypothetical protein